MREFADWTKIAYLSNLMRLYRTVLHELQDKQAAKQACEELYQKFRQIYSMKLMRQTSRKMRVRCMLFMLFPVPYSALEYARLKEKGAL